MSEKWFAFRKPQDPEAKNREDDLDDDRVVRKSNVMKFQTPPGVLLDPTTGEVITNARDGDEAAKRLRENAEQREAA